MDVFPGRRKRPVCPRFHAGNLAPRWCSVAEYVCANFSEARNGIAQEQLGNEVVSYFVAENRAYTSRQAVIPSKLCGALDSCGSSAAIAATTVRVSHFLSNTFCQSSGKRPVCCFPTRREKKTKPTTDATVSDIPTTLGWKTAVKPPLTTIQAHPIAAKSASLPR